jgi:hypothetical protein
MNVRFLTFFEWLSKPPVWKTTMWMFLVFLFTLAFFVVRPFAGYFYRFYDTVIFRGLVRPMQDFLFSQLPFNAFWPLVLLILVHFFWRIARLSKSGLKLETVFLMGHLVLRRILVITVLFYWLWGFHYRGFQARQYFGLRIMALKEQRVKDELNKTLEHLLTLRYTMGYGDAASLPDSVMLSAKDEDMLASCQQAFAEWRMDVKGLSAWKRFSPDGTLLRLGTLGFYNPFTGECNIDGAVHPLQIWFLKAHEWTHAQGVTDEGDANFLAYLICLQSEEPAIVYSGQLEYLRHLLRALRSINPEIHQLTLQLLPSGIAADILDIRNRYAAYPDFMPKVREQVYDNYLKANGISEGLESYDRLVKMVFAYQRIKQI